MSRQLSSVSSNKSDRNNVQFDDKFVEIINNEHNVVNDNKNIIQIRYEDYFNILESKFVEIKINEQNLNNKRKYIFEDREED